MTDEPATPDHAARINELEQELATMRAQADNRIIQSELKAEAIRLGILDLDCLKLVETASLKLDEDGTVPEATAALARLKRDKPWMFTRPNSSHPRRTITGTATTEDGKGHDPQGVAGRARTTHQAELTGAAQQR